MDAKPVVPNGIDRNHVSVVLEFLAERIRQPREAAIVHPHRQVRTLAVGRADVPFVGVAGDPMFLSADALCGAVAALGALRSRAILPCQRCP
jgi:hypothetical protein